jgi:hypothetical protein
MLVANETTGSSRAQLLSEFGVEIGSAGGAKGLESESPSMAVVAAAQEGEEALKCSEVDHHAYRVRGEKAPHGETAF